MLNFKVLLLMFFLLLNFIFVNAIPHKRQKRFFPNLFGSYTSSEPLTATVASVTPKPTYFVPGPNDSKMSPTLIPAVPISYLTAANGQHFIVVRPVPSEDGSAFSNHIPVVKKSMKPQKNVAAASQFLGLSSTEILELNQLAKIIGVKDMHDLPPLEEVMILLGTTSKSETIKAVRDYASTPGGLELIKDYVLSYQPVKRLDKFQDKNVIGEITKNGAIESNDDEYYLDPLTKAMDDNSQQVGNNSTPNSEPGFFDKLRSFFSFGYYTETHEPKRPEESQTLLPDQLVPHFIIPVKSIMPVIDENSINSNLQRYPLTPFIQDMNPFAMKVFPIESTSSASATANAKNNKEYNETHIHNDGSSTDDIEDDGSNMKQLLVQFPSPKESNGFDEILSSTDSSMMNTVVLFESSTPKITAVA